MRQDAEPGSRAFRGRAGQLVQDRAGFVATSRLAAARDIEDLPQPPRGTYLDDRARMSERPIVMRSEVMGERQPEMAEEVRGVLRVDPQRPFVAPHRRV